MPRSARLGSLFGVDLRSLALFRIAIGALVAVDALQLLPLRGDFYSREGLVYASAYPTFLFVQGGSSTWVGLLLGLLALAGIALAAGFLTRPAALVAWVLLFDLQRRDPYVLDGGDRILLHMLFWGLFLPLGARFSIDALRRPGRYPEQRVASVASAALLLQPALIYFFSGLMKLEGPMWRGGTAAYYAVAQEIWARPLGDWIAARPGALTRGLTWATLAAELVCPLLLFSPWRTTALRLVATAALVLMQVGFAFSLELNLFPFVATTAVLPFLPSGAWGRRAGSGHAAAAASTSRGPLRRAASVAWQGFGAVAFALALVLNLEPALHARLLPAPVRAAAETLVSQGWSMYAPEVYRWDFHLVVSGLRADGTRLPIDDGGRTCSWPPIERLRSRYRTKVYLERLAGPGRQAELAMFCQWVRRRWNEAAGAAVLDAVEVGRWQRLNALPGESATETSAHLLTYPSPGTR
jgi:HTTM domain